MNLKLFKILATGMVSVLLNYAVAQSITITGNDLGDVMMYRNLRPGYEYTVSTNYAHHPRIAAVAWSASGYNVTMRSLLSFNLSASLPNRMLYILRNSVHVAISKRTIALRNVKYVDLASLKKR